MQGLLRRGQRGSVKWRYGSSKYSDYRRWRGRLRDCARGFRALAGCFPRRAISEAGHGHQHAEQRGESFGDLLSEKLAEGATLRGRKSPHVRFLQEAQRAVPSPRETSGGGERACGRSTCCAEET